MKHHPRFLAVATVLLAAACTPLAGPTQAPAGPSVARCDAVPHIAAPAEAYGDAPIYVANEMPTEEIAAWARGKPGFEELWIDREHNGWVTVAFSEGADVRQAELEALFPGVGVVAVGVDWTMSALHDLQRRVAEELMPDVASGSSISVFTGMVEVSIGVLSADRIAAVESAFAGERVCISGADPADVVPAGPQPIAGDGWRLLADEHPAGEPYRTGIATDAVSYRELWARIGLGGELPPVDFGAEVVVWFGAVYGSGCDHLRLDGVAVDHERSLLHAEIVLPGPPTGCNADANPHAYVVAVERAKLPRAPFAVQLGAADPPAGAPEERTIVEADLRRPGSVAAPDEVHGDPALREPQVVQPGDVIEPGFAMPFRMSVHCGIEWLGPLNDVAWRTQVPPGASDFIPPAWQAVVADEHLGLSVLLQTDPEPTITATANGHAVVYRATNEEPPGCD
jgi:hypothetical protein